MYRPGRGDIRLQSVEISLLPLLRLDCLVEVVAARFPWTAAIRLGVPVEIGTSEVAGAEPGSEVDPLVALVLAFADLPVNFDLPCCLRELIPRRRQNDGGFDSQLVVRVLSSRN